jgi:type IV pilus assembly protein PilY1
LLIPSPSAADDTEIFMTQFSGTGVSGGRPKVLIMFDNSGSMRDGVPQSKPDYDPNMNWTDPVAVEAAFDGAGDGVPDNFQTDRIYWSFDGNPPGLTTDRYVPSNSNQCHTSIAPLNDTGRYTDYLRVWREGQGLIGTETSTECECQYRQRDETCSGAVCGLAQKEREMR